MAQFYLKMEGDIFYLGEEEADSEKKKRPSSKKPAEQTSSDFAADAIPTSDAGNI